MTLTTAELSEKLGLSRATISRVLNGGQGVKPSTIAAIRQEMDRLVAALGSQSEQNTLTAESGAASGKETLRAMDAIQRTSRSMLSAVVMIEEIANQTTLLSLNAAQSKTMKPGES